MFTEEDVVDNLRNKGKLSGFVRGEFRVKYIYLEEITIALVETATKTLKGLAICSSKDNYNRDFGRLIAFSNAVSKRW